MNKDDCGFDADKQERSSGSGENIDYEKRYWELAAENQRLKSDIEDLEQVEKLLRKSKAWFRAIFEGSSIGIALLNTAGVLIEANPAMEGILGYSSEELRGLGSESFISYEHTEEEEDYYKELIEGKIESYQIEKHYLHKTGRSVWINIRASYIESNNDDFKFIIAMVEDITQRKTAENRQEGLLKELEKINLELDNFAYIVSHDLKAPLRGIGSLANWIVNDYKDKLDDEGKEIVNLLINRVDRMKNLIDGILQYSRISRIKGSKTEVNLNKIVADVIDIIAAPANITIEVENELPVIACEKIRIEQVFQNLISNSIKFMDKDKGIIKIGCSSEGESWKFHVSDNGPGIDAKYYEKVFQIFQTLTSRDEFESTGIGLSIVKKIIETNGGTIWIESEVGVGTTFYFKLPKHVG